LASSLYGRGLAKLKKSNATAGGADITAAKAIEANIVGDFARYGVPQRRRGGHRRIFHQTQEPHRRQEWRPVHA